MNSVKPILLVEDDDVDIMTVKRALKQLQFANRLNIAKNGEDALTMLTDPHDAMPCIIILDLNMPKMNGIEFLGHLKQHELLRQIPVIIFTTSNDQQDKHTCFELGIAGYMLKPIDFQHFMTIMSTIISYWTMSELP